MKGASASRSPRGSPGRFRHDAGRLPGAPLLLALLALGCGPPGPPRPPSLLLISIDTLRADHLHVYGYARETSPHIDALAASGARFANAWAHSPWTLPSHATILSGTLPFRHGVVDDGTTIRPSLPLLAPILRARGYATAGVVSGFYVSSRFGFERGFDTFHDFGLAEEQRARDSVRAEEVSSEAIRRLGEIGDRPFFLFVHYFDPHNDYNAPPPWNRTFDENAAVVPYRDYAYYRQHPLDPETLAHVVAQYDEEIRYTDEMVGRLLEALRSRGRAKDTVVVLLSDHGEELFDHGSWGHGHSLYTEVLHVPLIVAGPGVASGRVVAPLTRHEDLLPTFLDLLGVPQEAGIEGVSFAPSVREGPPPGGAPRFLLADTSRFDSNLVGAVAEPRALILDLAAERIGLFDLAADPAEKTDLAARNPEEALALRRRILEASLAATPERWIVTWDPALSACAHVDGMILGEGTPGESAGATLQALATAPLGAPDRVARFATVPPDAPLWLFAGRSRSEGACSWPPAKGLPAATDLARGLVRLDPLEDGDALREGRSFELPGARGARLSVRIESERAAAPPSHLTPEEEERLRSLGYVR